MEGGAAIRNNRGRRRIGHAKVSGVAAHQADTQPREIGVAGVANGEGARHGSAAYRRAAKVGVIRRAGRGVAIENVQAVATDHNFGFLGCNRGDKCREKVDITRTGSINRG